MVDKISKALNKFTQKEKDLVKSLLLKISKNNFEGMNIKKLKGRADIFRARKGKIRIIYRLSNGQIYLLVIERRSDNTYNDF